MGVLRKWVVVQLSCDSPRHGRDERAYSPGEYKGKDVEDCLDLARRGGWQFADGVRAQVGDEFPSTYCPLHPARDSQPTPPEGVYDEASPSPNP